MQILLVAISTYSASIGQLLVPVQKHLSTHYSFQLFYQLIYLTLHFFHLLAMHLNMYDLIKPASFCLLFAPLSHHHRFQVISPRLYGWFGEFQNHGYTKATT